ncbi:dNTP triphosphohydrolase [Propioniciclava sp. MC1595]|nr:dNTP triphosphohydrolase [Propioniciclava sp. MC1595]QTE26640.1 dNTP triphosphohydrolase [Propioniciclava sp. MC1595]
MAEKARWRTRFVAAQVLTSNQPSWLSSRTMPIVPDPRRRASGDTSDTADVRSEYQRDLDRLFYSQYFLRLAEVTQVYAPRPQNSRARGPLLHNRLTHSLKVGQVGRRLAQRLNESAPGLGIDPDLVEAAGRAHDFGHPPYGHLGERVLDTIARRRGLPDGFEGNAQTFRILAYLATHPTHANLIGDHGLDLTAGVLAACVKYPRPRAAEGEAFYKFGYYECDAGAFEERVRPLLGAEGRATLAAQVMDWADDITYAVHDVDDFFRAALIPLERLAHREEGSSPIPLHPEETDQFRRYAENQIRSDSELFESAFRAFQVHATKFPRAPFNDGRTMRKLLGRLSSDIITKANGAATVVDGKLVLAPDVTGLVGILKQLTWYYVIDRPELATIQGGQRRMLSGVTASLIDSATDAFARTRTRPWGKEEELTDGDMAVRRQALPPMLRDLIEMQLERDTREAYQTADQNIVRAVLDYVSMLSERDVEEHYELARPYPRTVDVTNWHD